MGTPSTSYWFIHSLADIDHLGSLITFRLLRLLPNCLKTSKYGHISTPCRITCSPFHLALGTINYAYGLPVLLHRDRLATSGNVVLIPAMTHLLPRSLRCYAPLIKRSDNGSVTSLKSTSSWTRHINLDDYTIGLPRAAMGHLRVVGWMFSSLIYATAF